MKISIITVTLNSESTLSKTINSVKIQDYPDIEYIIVDGCSSDNTLNIINDNKDFVSNWISEKDFGIYDAMNKGYFMSSGDIIAFLNSDDYYYDSNVINSVMNIFSNPFIDFVYGNLLIIGSSGEILRQWDPGEIGDKGLISSQIPHPCLFVRRSVLDKIIPPFDSSLKISSDIKQQLIFINKFNCKGYYLNKILTVMSNGGSSTNSIKSYILGWKETTKAYNEIFGKGGVLFTIKKVLSKVKGVKNLSLITKR